MDEWLALMSFYFLSENHLDVEMDSSRGTDKIQPFIRLELALSDRKVFVKPERGTIQRKMKKVLNTIVDVSCQIPRLERIFLTGT